MSQVMLKQTKSLIDISDINSNLADDTEADFKTKMNNTVLNLRQTLKISQNLYQRGLWKNTHNEVVANHMGTSGIGLVSKKQIE